ncbi:hypothetical protein GOBAR_AA03375 [Gossypium barbadense]|uniref:Uncharacterized protein n=1 Tax=Gossypium barbadense TaxID=3634 RepID=A0A2P5YNM5_GOSBA|nr:hypothetical protein GOBAR_AA03375 [Gossypium barbadense]
MQCEASGGGSSNSEYQPYGHNMDNEQLNYMVSETCVQNTETALKNQQALIQGLKTQIGQLSKLISKRPQGSLPSNTESNPREQINAINIQDDEGVVETEPEPRQETVVSKGQGENVLDTSPNQLMIGDKVVLDAADPHILTAKENEEFPLTVLSIFPFGTIEVSHPKFGTFKVFHRDTTKHTGVLRAVCKQGNGTISSSRGKKATVSALKKKKVASSSSGPTAEVLEQVQLAEAIRALLTIDPWELFFGIIEPTYLELTMELCSTFHLQTVMTKYDDPGTEENDFHALNCHIQRSPSRCWDALVPGGATYNSSRSKASALLPYLRYLHAILAHMITGRRESTGVINTHDAYFLWCMLHRHVIDLAYFTALAIQHQMERHRKGVISIGPYVTWLARHFGLLNTAAQESSLTLISQMSPQGISSMLSMRNLPSSISSRPIYRGGGLQGHSS